MIMAVGLAAILLAAAGGTRTHPQIPEFKKGTQILQGPARIWGIAAADLDADGDLDIVLGALDGGPLVWLNDGRGGFRGSGQAFGVEMHGVAIGDLDRDGDPDLFFAPIRNNKPALYWNDGRGSFRSTPLLAGPSESVQLVDADRDGDLDAYLGKGSVLFVNDGQGGFSPGRLPVPDYSTLADLNGDGFIDAVAAAPGRGFEVFLNDGKGNFVSSCLASNKDLILAALHFTDIDGDGDIDVVYVNALDEGRLASGLLLNDGTGRLTDSGQTLGPPAAYGSAASGDLNGDGRKDIVITDAAGPARIWLNSGQGTFVDSGLRLGEETWMTNVLICDLDGDGDLDLFIPNRRTGRLEIWFNQLSETGR
ncbi:MAG: VCBS repeat-containing protein [Acidobacteriota bacterium]